jgi:hypothetical protein
MLLSLLTIAPVGLGLTLLVFGVPERPLLALTPRNLGLVALAAVLLGPVAATALGFIGWLILLAGLVAAAVIAAGLRPARRPGLQR